MCLHWLKSQRLWYVQGPGKSYRSQEDLSSILQWLELVSNLSLMTERWPSVCSQQCHRQWHWSTRSSHGQLTVVFKTSHFMCFPIEFSSLSHAIDLHCRVLYWTVQWSSSLWLVKLLLRMLFYCYSEFLMKDKGKLLSRLTMWKTCFF